MPLGLRYPGSSLSNGMADPLVPITRSFTSGPVSGDASLAVTNEEARCYAAPSRYSAVRKVVFAVAFYHRQDVGALGVPVRLRIAVSSSSTTVGLLDTITLAPSSIVISRGGGSVWQQEIPTAAGAFYSKVGFSVLPLQAASDSQTGAQIVFLEFDRFEAASAAFFDDWDEAATRGEDAYVAYHAAVERQTGSWTTGGVGDIDRHPEIMSMGMTVVQAPALPNNSCGMFQATWGMDQDFGITNAAFGGRHMPIKYNAIDWDNISAVHLIHRQSSSNAVLTQGNFSQLVHTIQDQVMGAVSVPNTEEQFDLEGTGNTTWLARSKDLKADLIDGGFHTVLYRAETVGNQDIPWGWWEFIQKDFTRTVSVFMCGMSLPISPTEMEPAQPPPDSFAWDEVLFDPLWFDNLPDDLVLKSNVWLALNHRVAVNDTRHELTTNSQLDVDMTADAFTVEISPEKSSTPDATIGFKLADAPITANNPLLFAGRRKIKLEYGGTSWLGGSDDLPGNGGLAYSLSIPNSEFIELGPIFALGEFNPEGCASTAAGLGDPGLLVITNGSVPPKHFNPADGSIEDNGVPVPFPDETPSSLVEDTAASPAGGLQAAIYTYRYTFRNCCTNKESDPNPDDIVVDTSGASPAAKVTLSFAGVRIPADPQICEICIYRTVANASFPVMAKVGCFDPDLVTVFVDEVSDSALDFINDGLSLLNAPMPCTPVVEEFRNRLFAMGDIPQLTPAGTVSAVNGSDTIIGDADVVWDRCLEGKFIDIEGDCRLREINRVLPPEVGTSPAVGRLELTEEYDGTTGTEFSYSICGRPNRVYVSEPLEPECFPLASFMDIEPGDGDRIIGAVANFDRLIICKRRKTYVLTFRENPVLETNVPSRISSDIGCIGPRTFAQVESGSVWLSDRGIAIYDGRTVRHLPASDRMNNLFIDPANDNYVRRDQNGRVIDAVGVFYPKREQYLLLVPTKNTDRGCDLMIVWDVKLDNITILKFCQEFQALEVGKDSDGNEVVYMGDVNGFVWIYDVGDTDGVGFPNNTGTVKGTITNVGVDDQGASFFDDSAASFVQGGLPELAGLSGIAGLSGAVFDGDLGMAGACVWIRRPDAALDEPYDIRFVYAATQTRVYVTPNWAGDQPQLGSEYILGAIEFRCVYKPNNFGTDDFLKRNWRQVVVHRIEDKPSTIRAEILPDFQNSDPEELTVVSADDAGEPATGAGRTFALTYFKGRQVRPVGRQIYNFQAIRISQIDSDAPVGLINHLLMSTPRQSK